MTDNIQEARAAQAVARAAESTDPKTAETYRHIAAGWMHIAEDLEFLAQREVRGARAK